MARFFRTIDLAPAFRGLGMADHPITPVRLGLVESRVGLGEEASTQGFEVPVTDTGKDRADPDGHGDAQGFFTVDDGHRCTGDLQAYALGQVLGLVRTGLWKEQRKLLAPVAGCDVAGAQTGLDPLRRLHQHLISRGMAPGVVDALEVVGVQKQAAEGQAVTSRARRFFLEPVFQVATVVQAGQGVGQSAEKQPFPVDHVFQAKGGDGGEAIEKIAPVVSGEAVRNPTAQVETAHQFPAAHHRQQGDAAQ